MINQLLSIAINVSNILLFLLLLLLKRKKNVLIDCSRIWLIIMLCCTFFQLRNNLVNYLVPLLHFMHFMHIGPLHYYFLHILPSKHCTIVLRQKKTSMPLEKRSHSTNRAHIRTIIIPFHFQPYETVKVPVCEYAKFDGMLLVYTIKT